MPDGPLSVNRGAVAPQLVYRAVRATPLSSSLHSDLISLRELIDCGAGAPQLVNQQVCEDCPAVRGAGKGFVFYLLRRGVFVSLDSTTQISARMPDGPLSVNRGAVAPQLVYRAVRAFYLLRRGVNLLFRH